MTDQFDHWNRRLAGEDVGCEEGKPQSGYYRSGDTACAIWRDEAGALHAFHGERYLSKELDIMRLWDFCHAKPITYELFEAVQNGAPWPDRSPEADALKNENPQTPEEFGKVLRVIRAAAQTVAKDEDEASRLSILADQAGAFEKAADSIRTTLVAPHLKAQRDINGTWNPVVDYFKAEKTRIKRELIEPFLLEKRRIEVERARAEAEKLRQDGDAVAAAKVEAAPVKASTKGGRVALRKVRVTTVTDIRAALRWFADRNEDVPAVLVEAVEKLAKGFADVGVVVAGTETRDDTRAA